MMFETVLALMGLAFLGGFGWCAFLLWEPAERRATWSRTREIRARARLQEERERPHLGTPYREATIERWQPRPPDTVMEAALLDLLADNQDHSKHADARVVSLPARTNRAV